jgi:hypothetical protein
MEYIAFIGKSENYLLSVDCLVKDHGYNIHPYFFKMVIVLVFPIMGIIGLVVFWMLYFLIKRNRLFIKYLI